MPRWTPEQKLRASVKRLVKLLRGDAYAARTRKLICETCMEPATGMCAARKHWVCDHCLGSHPCCEPPK
jgi:hypothetical protein